jgi:hypothetical protein
MARAAGKSTALQIEPLVFTGRIRDRILLPGRYRCQQDATQIERHDRNGAVNPTQVSTTTHSAGPYTGRPRAGTVICH